MPDDEIVVFLSCKHTARAPKGIANGADLHCRRCFRVSTVEEMPCYAVRCQGAPGRRCPVSRSFGSLIFSARQFSTRHRIRFPSHTTKILDRGTLVESSGPDLGDQPTLFELPPARPRVVYRRGEGFTSTRELDPYSGPPPF